MHVTIIAKEPVAGAVKTRLCPPCTPQQAADVAAAALADTFDAVALATAGSKVRRVLLLDGNRPTSTPAGTEVVAQRGNGLADRLRNGFADLGPGLIIGMETPGAARGIGPALCWLARGAHVLGLALDGGYWCIGLATADAELLDGVFGGLAMSTSQTGMAQLRRLHVTGSAVRLLERVRDLDTPDDLRAQATTGTGRLGVVARDVIGVQ